jgi:hypothetical protein
LQAFAAKRKIINKLENKRMRKANKSFKKEKKFNILTNIYK